MPSKNGLTRAEAQDLLGAMEARIMAALDRQRDDMRDVLAAYKENAEQRDKARGTQILWVGGAVGLLYTTAIGALAKALGIVK
jgi:hypothetical protein